MKNLFAIRKHKKVRTTSMLFLRWLLQRNQKRRIVVHDILLPFKNVSLYRMDESLSNVRPQMLLQNITAFLQPQDARIMSSFESQIAQIQHRQIVDRFDAILKRLPAFPERYKDKKLALFLMLICFPLCSWLSQHGCLSRARLQSTGRDTQNTG